MFRADSAVLWEDGTWRVDPTVLLISGRYTRDSPADPADEIEPFRDGTVNLDVHLAGLELAYVPMKDKMRFGINGSVGVTRYNDAGLLILSGSVFGQMTNLYRVEFGWMHAKSGSDEFAGSDGRGAANKTAFFVGVSFPLVSDQIRELAAKLK